MAATNSSSVPPLPAPPVSAPAPATAAAHAPGTDTGVPASLYGPLADGGFLAKLGTGLRLSAEQLAARELDLSTLPQPLPGVKLAKLRVVRDELRLEGSVEVPFLPHAEIRMGIKPDGTAKISGRLSARLQLAALGSPQVQLGLDESGNLSGAVEFSALTLTPRALRATATGSGRLELVNGRFGGAIHAELGYPAVGAASADLGFGPEGAFTASGTVTLTPPFLDALSATLAADAEGNLTAQLQVEAAGRVSPLPGLVLEAGTALIGYRNGVPSLALTGFAASYAGVGRVSIESLLLDGHRTQFSADGTLLLTIPGMSEVTGQVRVRESKVSGRLQLGVRDFPQGLPLRNGQLTVTLQESGQLVFSGRVTVALGPAGQGQLAASYEQGVLTLGAQVQLTVPGMAPVMVNVSYINGDLTGSVDAPINSELLPGLSGAVHIEYAQDRWSGTTTLNYAADDGKLAGSVTVTVAQAEDNSLQLGGSGQVTAQLMPNLAGTLNATILPEGGVDVSGTIEVAKPVELFPEKRLEKELFSHSQDIPLWAILVAVIRIRAGVRAGIGPGVFRNITVTGSYTIGATEADPSFKVTGQLFIPAFVEGYVAFGAGLGLDVVLGELTGGIEAVGTAGLYGAISVIPELVYEHGQWSIAGVATLAAGARLKLSLNAWAEVEAFWVTVWDNTWKLASITMPLGPNLALQAKMNYVFGRPEPPELDFSSSNVDAESLIQSAMPEDGPPLSGAREALENKAEWKGALREQSAAAVPPELAAQAQQGDAAPPAPARPPKPAGPPPGKSAESTAGGPSAPTPAPGDSAAASAEQAAVIEAATPDAALPHAVPAEQLPVNEKPRYPGPVTLATLDEPPVPVPRTQTQEHEDLAAAKRAVELASAQASSSDTLDDYFPRIKNRFRLSSLAYEGDFESGFDVVGSINPQFKAQLSGEPLQGRGIDAAAGPPHRTEVKFFSSQLEGTEVGIEMLARPLGPDHPLGSEPQGQQSLMDRLGTEYIRGHLLNEHLGGPGEPRNLFPITRSANALHSSRMEETIKRWVNTERYWVQYDVKILGQDRIATDDQGREYINSRIKAEAWVLDTNLERFKSVSTEIASRYGLDSSASRQASNEKTAGQVAAAGLARPSDLVRPEDLAAEVLVSAEGRTPFPNFMRSELGAKLAVSNWNTLLAKLRNFPGFGEAAAQVLPKAYTLALASSDALVSLDSPAEKARLTWIVNRWAELREELE